MELFDLTMEPQRNFNPERELELGILVIVSLSSNYLFLYHVTLPLELFIFRGIGRPCTRSGVASESEFLSHSLQIHPRDSEPAFLTRAVPSYGTLSLLTLYL